MLSIFNTGGNVNGIPTLYLYVFMVWILLITVIFRILRKEGKESKKDE
ncbi:MAG: hypothetical protein H7339_04160 [Arcicella sp.]|nr:hypothetical protein [Arcicella sp.]